MSNALGHFSNDDMEEVARTLLLGHEGGRLYYTTWWYYRKISLPLFQSWNRLQMYVREVYEVKQDPFEILGTHMSTRKRRLSYAPSTLDSHTFIPFLSFLWRCVQKSRNSLEPRVKIFSFNVFQHPILQRWDLSLTVFFHSVYEHIFAICKQDLE